ncbi:amino acid permease [Microbacterium paraoxydans]|uniref:Amino acid permease n=1 Tax=Microbacterium paraoxydans TaxID=199592 RepID=A0ABS5IN87_9MICO|nr:amino acid permease [Microbacterium paraoxydans]MBS0024404.1 amino acid permease [Microbacterium paraoxydans]
MATTDAHQPHDTGTERENERERLGDVATSVQDFSHEQHGYKAALKGRHLQMIALGGAIGTGLFMGAGGRLHSAGPLLAVSYLVCGVFAFFILRALGELVIHRPSSGSFISYAREFYGEKLAFAAGWLYLLNWGMVAIVDSTAVALYVHYWSAFRVLPQWLVALIALIVVVGLNLVSVRLFGEMEFWFSIVKVGALALFLVVGIVFLAAGWHTDQGPTGLAMLAAHGGFMPEGILPAVIVMQGVVFAYASIELVGTAAGETQDPEKLMPRAVNSVILRIGVFYVGSVLLLALLLPYTVYQAGESPFVTFFSHIGGPEVGAVAGSVMNFIVITAAVSGLNAGLYSTGRVFHSLASSGAAPRVAARMSKRGVPVAGIVFTAIFALGGVLLNAVVPESAFEIVLNLSALGIITAWGTIILCQLRLQKLAALGKLQRPAFRLFGAPFTSYLTLAFLASVVVLMALDYPTGTWTVGSLVVVIPALIGGWFLARRRILEYAAARSGHTAPHPTL